MTQKFTPQQACSAANLAGNQKVEEFIMESSVLELQEFCHCLNEGHPHDKYFPLARIAIDIKLAEEQSKSAAKMERFTCWLIVLTVALVVFAFFDFAEIGVRFIEWLCRACLSH